MGKRSRSYSVSSSSSGSSPASSEDDSRSRKRRSRKGKERERDRDRDDDDRRSTKKDSRYKLGTSERINAKDDFYAKSKEFRYWLSHREKKPKQFAKLDSKDQKRYFKKFVKKWNKGKLDRGYYDGSIVGERQMVSSATEGLGVSSGMRLGPQIGPALGPTLPSSLDDIAMQREAELDHRASQRDAERSEYKRNQRETRQEERENRATGRDRIQEKRAEKRESGRAMAAAKEQGDMEFGEDYLMGGTSSSFADAIRRRDASKVHRERERKQMEKQIVLSEKQSELKKKENDTMAMFKAIAAAKYGGSS